MGSQVIGTVKGGSKSKPTGFNLVPNCTFLIKDLAVVAEPKDDLNHTMFSRDEMGNLVWTVMHLYTAYFPDEPTETEKEEVFTLIKLL